MAGDYPSFSPLSDCPGLRFSRQLTTAPLRQVHVQMPIRAAMVVSLIGGCRGGGWDAGFCGDVGVARAGMLSWSLLTLTPDLDAIVTGFLTGLRDWLRLGSGELARRVQGAAIGGSNWARGLSSSMVGGSVRSVDCEVFKFWEAREISRFFAGDPLGRPPALKFQGQPSGSTAGWLRASPSGAKEACQG